MRNPWLQFLLIGLALYWVGQVAFPEPRPVLGPPNPERLAALAENYLKFSGTPVGDAQRDRFVDAELRDELLFREAIKRELYLGDVAVEQRLIRNMRFLDSQTDASDQALLVQAYALKLHLTDEVVRRRMVQIMERLIVAFASLPPPDPETIADRYQQSLDQWEEPARYSFSHVFLPLERLQEMPALIEQVQRDQLDARTARHLGGPFLSGYDFRLQSSDQIARVFGVDFAERFATIDREGGDWVGPIESVFGLHYVWVEQVVPARLQALEAVSERIVNDLIRENEARAIEEWVESTMSRYEVRRS
jgi:hypothetical protein